MRRRDFITAIGGAAAWPLLVHAQERIRRIGFLTASFDVDDPEMQTRQSALVLALREYGWIVGRNIRVEFRSGAGKVSELRKQATELASFADVILANGGQAVSALRDVSRNVPIVFVSVPDPVGAGFVESLARPGGNSTGFTNFEYAIVAKWLELLKEIAPTVRQVAVVRDPSNAAGSGQWGAIQLAASSIKVELSSINSRIGSDEIERAFTSFARQPDGGVIVTGNTGSASRRETFVNLAARHKLPAVYPNHHWVTLGGLVGYGPNSADQYRNAADYISRILKGERPANLPVQVPTRYRLTINHKSAKALGLTVPPTLLARADEVIE
jgi:putative tryptophan/tyrosine transport system substrate-binding protein